MHDCETDARPQAREHIAPIEPLQVGDEDADDESRFEAFTQARLARDPNSQSIFGGKQEAWLKQTLQASTATWKVLATSISMTSMIVDARIMPQALENKPDTELVRSGLQVFKGLLPGAYLLSVDQWDGFPAKRNEILELIRRGRQANAQAAVTRKNEEAAKSDFVEQQGGIY